MNEQVEKLRDEIAEQFNYVSKLPRRSKLSSETRWAKDQCDANLVLLACKKAGLKFVPESWILPSQMPFHCDPEIPMASKTGVSIQKTIGLTVARVKEIINSQIKEIEI